MAGRSLMFNGSTMVPSYSNTSDQPLGSLFMHAPSSFLGSRSMLNFKDVNGGNRLEKSLFRTFDQIDNGDEDLDEYFHQPEKKRRLTVEQVQFLEKSFEVENKLEPERKVQLAKELGLQPRQIAIWFQNRRARWKTRNLEKEYEILKSSYETLKVDYDTLHNEKEKLKAEVLHLSDKLQLKDNEKESNLCDNKLFVGSSSSLLQEPLTDSISSGALTMAFKQEDPSSAKSDVLDSDSPHYTDGSHSSFLEPGGDSSYVFEPEPEQSDVSQDEEDYLSRNFFTPTCGFSKIEDENSSYFGFPLEDHAFNFWSS